VIFYYLPAITDWMSHLSLPWLLLTAACIGVCVVILQGLSHPLFHLMRTKR
jgi:hypothetical protein